MRRLLVLVVVAVAAAACGESGDDPGTGQLADESDGGVGAEIDDPGQGSTSDTEEADGTEVEEDAATDAEEVAATDANGSAAEAEEYAAAIASAVLNDDGGPDANEAEARCVGDAVVEQMGLEWVKGLGDPVEAGAVFVDGNPEVETARAGGLAEALVVCVPAISTVVATSLSDASGIELTDAEIDCMAKAAQGVTVTMLADALVDESPSPFVVGIGEAEDVARKFVACTPAVAEFYRSAVLEGIDLAQGEEAEVDEPFVDCVLAMVNDELMVPIIATTISGLGGVGGLVALIQWVAVESQTCAATRAITALDEVAGSYILQGTNPGRPNLGYSGEVQLVLAGDGTLDVTWVIGDSEFTGSATLREGALDTTFSAPVQGTGLWRLTEEGTLVGRWGETGSDETGTEVWVPT